MSQLRPQGHDLENRVDYLENRAEQIGRKVYGDPPNRVMPLDARLDAIEARLETMARHALYWRMGQTGLLLIIAGMLLGVVLR